MRLREYWWPRAKTAEQIRQKAFGPSGGSFRDADSTKQVGSQIHIGSTRASKPAITMGAVDSTLRLWGTEGQRILGGLRIGVAGAGGVGGMLVEQLARLGVGDMVLVDYDDLKVENLNRAQGAKQSDLGNPKIEYVKRLARQSATCKGFRIETVLGSVAEWEGLRPLLDCDIILNAADSPFARQVLDHVSYAYEIPVVDGGTVFLVGADGRITGRSQVSEAGPGRPCLECQGVYTREEATLARESPHQQGPNRYLGTADALPPGGAIPRAPSVISHNGLVASLMAQRLLRIALGFPPEGESWQQRFYVELGEIRWGPVLACESECPKASWTGLGDNHPTPVGIDPFLQELRSRRTKPSVLGIIARRRALAEARS